MIFMYSFSISPKGLKVNGLQFLLVLKLIKLFIDTIALCMIGFLVALSGDLNVPYLITSAIFVGALKLFVDNRTFRKEANFLGEYTLSLQSYFIRKYPSLFFKDRQQVNQSQALDYLINKSFSATQWISAQVEVKSNIFFLVISLLVFAPYLAFNLNLSFDLLGFIILILSFITFVVLIYYTKLGVLSKTLRPLFLRLGFASTQNESEYIKNIVALDTHMHLSFEEYLNNIQLLKVSNYLPRRSDDVIKSAHENAFAKRCQRISASRVRANLEFIILLIPVIVTIPLKQFTSDSFAFVSTFFLLRTFLSISTILQNIKVIDYASQAIDDFNKFVHMRTVDTSNLLPPSNSSALICTNINYSYTSNCDIIKNFSYEFKPSNLYVIRGKSGAGKSTLLSLISQEIHLDSGRITYPFESNLWYQSQSSSAVSKTFRENISYPSYQHISYDIYKNILRKYSLPESFSPDSLVCRTNPRNISGGQEKRLLLARAEFNDNNIILLDEPTAGLDKITAELMTTYINHLKHNNRIIICSSHEPSLIKAADHLISL